MLICLWKSCCWQCAGTHKYAIRFHSPLHLSYRWSLDNALILVPKLHQYAILMCIHISVLNIWWLVIRIADKQKLNVLLWCIPGLKISFCLLIAVCALMVMQSKDTSSLFHIIQQVKISIGNPCWNHNRLNNLRGGKLTDQCWWHRDWGCWLYTSSHPEWQRCHSGSC